MSPLPVEKSSASGQPVPASRQPVAASGQHAAASGQHAPASGQPATASGQHAAASRQSPRKVLVFGGTSEGRELVSWLAARADCQITASSATDYGGSLIQEGPRVRSLAGRLPEAEIEALMRRERFTCVVDATHPYATSITASIERAAKSTGTPLLRLLREGEPEGPWLGARDAADAARMLASLPGRILLTTGSKDLPVFSAGIPDFAERTYARVLPRDSHAGPLLTGAQQRPDPSTGN